MVDINYIKYKFSETYNNFKWRGGTFVVSESRSGEGSSLFYSETYRKELPELISRFEIIKILDCSCGDWNWMKTISSELINYTGIDIVPELIENNKRLYENDFIKFQCSDMLSFLNETDVIYDLVISRHTFEHLPEKYNIESMNKIKEKTKFALISTQDVVSVNRDVAFDGFTTRNINLKLTPYKEILGDPIYEFIDSPFVDGKLLDPKSFAYLYKF